MIILDLPGLTDDMTDELTDLVLDINEADGTSYETPLDADFYILLYDDGAGGFKFIDTPEEAADAAIKYRDFLRSALALYEMGETYKDRTVFELSALTSPAHRRKGYLKLLLARARYEICLSPGEGGTGYVFRFAVYENELNLGVLKHLGAVKDHDEMLMAISLSDFHAETLYIADETSFEMTETEEDGETFSEGTASTEFGECRMRIYDNYAYIYGILTYAGFQRRGHARKLLRRVLEYLKEKNLEEAVLEVSDANTAAFGLYRSLGFEIAERLSYYYILNE